MPYRPLHELTPTHWQNATLTTTDGTHLHYIRTGGTKPPLLLLHGVQGMGLMWLRTAQALESTYDLVMPDFRGHGQSDRLTHGFSLDLLVQDTLTLIDSLNLDHLVVIGHSMGAEIAGLLAAIHPLRGVVLVDPALQNFMAKMPPFDLENPPPWMVSILEGIKALRTQSHAERMVTGQRLLPYGSQILNEADYVSFVEAQAQFDLDLYRYLAGMGYLFEDPATIAHIDCPILLLSANPMLPGANIATGIAAFESNWRNGQHRHFEECGHFIMFDQLERFVAVLLEFLNRVES